MDSSEDPVWDVALPGDMRSERYDARSCCMRHGRVNPYFRGRLARRRQRRAVVFRLGEAHHQAVARLGCPALLAIDARRSSLSSRYSPEKQQTMIGFSAWLLPGFLPAATIGTAEAKPAHCTTTDDGSYACDFKLTDTDGSFQITAPGKPTYAIVIEEPGRASAFVNLGNRNISLAGTYVRSKTNPACWVSDAAPARICAK